MQIKPVTYDDTKIWILKKHYAQRMPHVTWAFGLFDNEEIVGVLTIGKPASPYLCMGVCGEEYKDKVYELNRLCVNDGLPKNTLSFFVGGVLKLLKDRDLILVSFADDNAGHHGYIYQATNWYYTGKNRTRTDKYMPGGKHARHYTEEFAHIRKFRSSKHRYIYFTGKSKKMYLKKLKYPIQPYPKGDNTRYVLGEKIKEKMIDTTKNEVFYE
jgi:hypothetical protein